MEELKVYSDKVIPQVINEAVATLRDGGVMVYPTDTIYGLGCDVFNKKAVENIYRIKHREAKKPMSILCSDISMVAEYAQVPNEIFTLLKKILPGPYTFILKANRKTPHSVVSKNKTVGIRIPDNDLSRSIVKELGNPIVTTSLNISGNQALTNPNQMDAEMRNQINLILNAGDLEEEASTIIDLSGDTPHILREGKGDVSFLGH